MDEDTTPKRPSFGAFQVKDGPEGQSYFNRIGSAFVHKDGQGHTVQLDAVPVDGRVILRTPQERVADARSKGTRRSRREEIER